MPIVQRVLPALLLGLLLSSIPGPALAQTFQVPASTYDRIRLSAQYWRGSLEGNLGLVEIQEFIPGQIDVGLLGFGEDGDGWAFELQAGAGRRHRFILELSQLDLTADTALDPGEIIFDDPAGFTVPVSSFVNFRDVHGAYDFLIVARPSVEAGVQIRAGYVELESAVDAMFASAETQLDAPYPAIGGNVMINPAGRARVWLEIAGFPEVDIDEFTAALLDVEARLEVFVTENLAALVGYRRYELDFEETDEISLDLKWSGLTFGGQLRF